MLDLRIIADGQPLTALELVLKLGKPAAADEIAAQIEALIATLDKLDGDTDVELNGDELDGNGTAEDEFYPHGRHDHANPGCPLADPGGGDADDEGEKEDGILDPIYGIDQSAGPTNHDLAVMEHLQREHPNSHPLAWYNRTKR